jgi:hypothetical protein
MAAVTSNRFLGHRANGRLALVLIVAAALELHPGGAAVAADGAFAIEVQAVSSGDAGASTVSLPASHQQVKLIAPAQGSGRLKLASFCVTKDGRIVTVLDREEASATNTGLLGAIISALGSSSESSAPASNAGGTTVESKKTKPLDSPAEVRILDADGKLIDQWPLDFQAQAVNVCPDGNLVLGGAGVLARYDLKGKDIARCESPHIVASRKDPDELKRRAREMAEEQRNSLKTALASFEEQKAELAKKDKNSLTAEEKQTLEQIDQIIAAYKQASGTQADKPITEEEVNALAQGLTDQAQKINAISSNGKHIFCTAPASKGYGYSVWRTDMDFSNPKRIVDGLSGCCGQMDIQCCGEDIVVAENSRKRVVRYNSDGKEVASWGKGSRDGEGDTFGSCCNPMNTRAVGDKLYVSDSDGRVRLFTLDGTYTGEIGKADVQPGCKSSIVDVGPDGKRVYYIDVNSSKICVLDQKPAANTVAR